MGSQSENTRSIPLHSEDGLFDVDRFNSLLKTEWLGADFIYLEQTESTNTTLREMPADILEHGTVLLADNQLSGRGQYKRKWESDPARNLTFTIAYKPPDTSQLPYLTLVTAWALTQVLNRDFGEGFSIKWPNDLMYNGRKLGGLLTESVYNGQHLERVLIGIGLNVNQTEFSPDIADKATSLSLICERILDRENLMCLLLKEAEEAYRRWYASEKQLLTDVNHALIGYGQWVHISVNGNVKTEEFKFLGVNEKGQLVVLSKDLEVKIYSYEQIRIESGYQSS